VLLRAAQESLANIRKHAAARSASVRLEYATETVRLEVRDDGVGFEPGVSDCTAAVTAALERGILPRRPEVSERLLLAGARLIYCSVIRNRIPCRLPREVPDVRDNGGREHDVRIAQPRHG
jgi:signal transduction histidine kinase